MNTFELLKEAYLNGVKATQTRITYKLKQMLNIAHTQCTLYFVVCF